MSKSTSPASPNGRAPADWTDEEFAAVLAAVAKLPGRYRRPRTRARRRDWWRAYLLLARETGLNFRRLVRCHRDDFNRRGRLVLQISRDEWRVFHPSDETVAALEPLRRDGPARFLSLSTWPARLIRDWRSIAEAAGVSDVWYTPRRRSAEWGQCTKPSQSLASYFDEAYLPLKLRSRSERTAVLYRRTIRLYCESLGRAALLSDLTDDAVSRHLAALAARGLARHTVVKEHDQLCAMWRFAAQRRLVDAFPTIQRGRLPEFAPFAWTIADLDKLFAAVAETPGLVGKIPACDWWRALLLALYDSGERISAVMQLTWDHFDLEDERAFVTVPAEFRKGKTRDIVSRLHPETAAALRHIKRSGGLAFPWPHSPTMLWYYYGLILERAGLPNDARSKFHRIRRTTASYFERAGQNATELLDHSSRKVTRRYLDARIVERVGACDVLPRPTAGKPRKAGAA